MIVKEKNLVLQKVRKNLKKEVDPSLLNLKNIEKIEVN